MNQFIIIAVLIIIFILIFSLAKAFGARRKVEKEFETKGIDFLISSLKSEDPNIKEQAITKLGKIKDPRATDALIDFIKTPEVQEDEEGYFLSLALNSLSNIGDEKAKKFFLSSFQDERLGFRALIALSLGNMAQKKIKIFEAIEPLILLLKDLVEAKEGKNPEFYNEYLDWTEEALRSITEQNFGIDVAKWEKWYKENKEIYLVH